jgi:hypothetical protein
MKENMQKNTLTRSFTRSALTAGVLAIVSSMGAYAADGDTTSTAPVQAAATSDAPVSSTSDTSVPASDAAAAAPVSDTSAPKSETVAAAPVVQPTASMVPSEASASSALKQKTTDTTTAKSLDETFTASERQYSLSKRGSYSLIYDLGYSYFANTALDLALDSNSSTITRLRVENNAQHAITNTFTLQYGLLNNVTLTASLPMVTKYNPPTAATTAGLGDVNFGARWEPFPLGTTPLPITLFGTLTTPTGDSPYDINPLTELSTGQGYYSLGGGVSTRKYIDPIVLFGTLSMNYGLQKNGLNFISGNRVLTDVTPGYTTGIGFGFAYSLNYDVSLTISYQQSFVFGSQFKFSDGTISHPTNSSSATLNSSLGIRVSPKTIVNFSLGFGLTPDSPNVVLGLSLPLDFLGLGRVVK